jgi:hypothetical protein
MAITVIKSSHFMGWTCEKIVKLLASGSSRMACWRILPFTSGISPASHVAALPLWQLHTVHARSFVSSVVLVQEKWIPQKSSANTLWLFNIAVENGPFIDGLPIKNCDFPWLC